MPEQFRVVFHNMAAPFGADDLVRDNVIKLERLLGENITCSVVIERRHRRYNRGNLYCIDVELMVSDSHFAVHRDPPERDSHEGLHIAIADAFDSVRRQLRSEPFAALDEDKMHAVLTTAAVRSCSLTSPTSQ